MLTCVFVFFRITHPFVLHRNPEPDIAEPAEIAGSVEVSWLFDNNLSGNSGDQRYRTLLLEHNNGSSMTTTSPQKPLSTTIDLPLELASAHHAILGAARVPHPTAATITCSQPHSGVLQGVRLVLETSPSTGQECYLLPITPTVVLLAIRTLLGSPLLPTVRVAGVCRTPTPIASNTTVGVIGNK